MKSAKLGSLALACFLIASAAAQAEKVEIVVWAPADRNERYRYEAVALAANILNEELKIEGRDIQVTIRPQAFSGVQSRCGRRSKPPHRARPKGQPRRWDARRRAAVAAGAGLGGRGQRPRGDSIPG